MTRSLALTVAFLVAGAVPALAQPHSPSHARTYPHGPGHVRPDSGQHAAMHALLHGAWRGTLSYRGVSSGLDLSVAHDSSRNLILSVSADRPIQAGAASNFVIDGERLQWTQDLSGASCQATAVLSAATPLVPERLKGKMACELGEGTFTLHKKAK